MQLKKKKWESKKLILQQRDIDIMDMMLKQKFLTLNQIWKNFYNQSYESFLRKWKEMEENGKAEGEYKSKWERGYARNAFVRLELMRNRKLIARRNVNVLVDAGHLYQCAKRGIREIEISGNFDHLTYLDRIDLKNFEHDRRLTDVRFKFESTGLVSNWLSERQIRAGKFQSVKTPDAFFILGNKIKTALELELTLKRPAAYQDIVNSYVNQDFEELLNSKVDIVLYICVSDNHINRIAEHMRLNKRFYFASYDDFLDKGDDCLFWNKYYRGAKKFRLSEFNK